MCTVKTILVTGFEPFKNDTINPSWEAVRLLEGWRGDGFEVVVRLLPCTFILASQMMAAALDELSPCVVIAVGQAGGRAEIMIERIAINIDDAPVPDNSQQQPVDQAIAIAGPAAYFSTLPIKAMARCLRDCGVPAAISQSAGTFVCNHVFYGLMHHLARQAPALAARAGFIHIPYLPQQAALVPGAASMALETIVAGLRAAIETAFNATHDLAEAGGQTH